MSTVALSTRDDRIFAANDRVPCMVAENTLEVVFALLIGRTSILPKNCDLETVAHVRGKEEQKDQEEGKGAWGRITRRKRLRHREHMVSGETAWRPRIFWVCTTVRGAYPAGSWLLDI